MLLQALGAHISSIHMKTMFMTQHKARTVLSLTPGVFYRVRAPTWSGFVVKEVRATHSSNEAESLFDVKGGRAAKEQYDKFDVLEFGSGEVLVFYVRHSMLTRLHQFVKDSAGARASPQIVVMDTARGSMMTEYILAQNEDSAQLFRHVLVNSASSETLMVRGVPYSFLFPDGTRALGCTVPPPVDHSHDGKSKTDYILLTLADPVPVGLDSKRALALLLKGVEDVRLRRMQTVLAGRGMPLNVYLTVCKYNDVKWALQVESTTARPLDTLVLETGKKEALMEDVRQFLANKKMYEAAGVAHRRGYMLHGPPGTGKTSLIRTMAGLFNMALCVVDFDELDDRSLARLMSSAPSHSIIVLEDLDHRFGKKQLERETMSSKRVTLSGLLNALDGIMVGDRSYIVVMSTNNLADLSPSLYRAGRCDVKVHLDYAKEDQVRQMTGRYFPDIGPETLTGFAEAAMKVTAGRLAPASLQVYLMARQGLPVERLLSDVKDLGLDAELVAAATVEAAIPATKDLASWMTMTMKLAASAAAGQTPGIEQEHEHEPTPTPTPALIHPALVDFPSSPEDVDDSDDSDTSDDSVTSDAKTFFSPVSLPTSPASSASNPPGVASVPVPAPAPAPVPAATSPSSSVENLRSCFE
jgi:hypothetical protein